MTGILDAEYGVCISREVLANFLNTHRKCLSIREKLPPNVPSTFSTQTRVLKLYRIIDKEKAIMAKSAAKTLLLGDIKYEYKKVRKFDKFDMEDNLAPHQKVIIAHIVTNKFANTNMTGSCLLQLDTGLGKTRIGVGLMARIGAMTCAIVPTKHIAEQWVEEIKEFAPHLRVCIYTNAKNQQFDKYDVFIIVFATARKKEASFYSNFALALIDEVHELTSKSNKNILWNINVCRFACGLTATPEYSGHGLLPFIEGHLGKTSYARDIPGFNVNCKVFKVKVVIANYVGDPEFRQPVINTGGTVCAIATVEKIISDPKRTTLIIDKINEMYDKGRNILVFAEHRQYLDKLYNILKERDIEVEIEDEMETLKGGVKKEVIERAFKSRIILTTYGYSRRGISYDHLDTLILASPRRTGHRQILGRILRYNSDESIERYVYDVCDIATVLKSQVRDRLKIYKERKYDIRYQHHEEENDDEPITMP